MGGEELEGLGRGKREICRATAWKTLGSIFKTRKYSFGLKKVQVTAYVKVIGVRYGVE